MTLLYGIVGIVPSILAGWMLMSGIEGPVRVLGRWERLAYGGLLGPAVTMLVAFVAAVGPGVPLNRAGFAFAHLLTLAAGALLWRLRAPGTGLRSLVPHRDGLRPAIPLTSLPRWAAATVLALVAWTGLKILVPAVTFLFLTPTFLDDSLDNWNMRAKVFHHTQTFTLVLPRESPNAINVGVSSYPPMVPLFKTWLVTLRGAWSEALANLPHLLWFLIAVTLIAAAVRRRAGSLWAILAAYVAVSLPLYLMHGTNSYADGFLSAHVAAAVFPLLFALWETDAPRRQAWLRIAAVMTGILVFTKNEAIVLYFPPLAVLTSAALFWMWKKRGMTGKDLRSAILWFAVAMVVLGLPWLAYKWLHGMAFGNAKQLSGLALQWHGGVALAIFINTYFEGNWILLFPLLFLLLALRWKQAFGTPLVLLVAFFLIVYLLQLFVFFFTPLAQEAIRQTGYARGLVHVVPVMVVITVLLLKDALKNHLPPWAR